MPTGCYFPSVKADTATGFGWSLGLRYRITDELALGAAYVSEQRFESFHWTTTHANPELPSFGSPRDATFRIDPPAVASIGLAWQRGPLALALDWKQMRYGSAAGFHTLGWRDIDVISIGGRWEISQRVTARAGYSRGDNPVPAAMSAVNVLSPAIFERHEAIGLGYRIAPRLGVDVAYYRSPKNAIEGPLLGPTGPVPGNHGAQRDLAAQPGGHVVVRDGSREWR